MYIFTAYLGNSTGQITLHRSISLKILKEIFIWCSVVKYATVATNWISIIIIIIIVQLASLQCVAPFTANKLTSRVACGIFHSEFVVWLVVLHCIQSLGLSVRTSWRPFRITVRNCCNKNSPGVINLIVHSNFNSSIYAVVIMAQSSCGSFDKRRTAQSAPNIHTNQALPTYSGRESVYGLYTAVVYSHHCHL